jgi:hypothetical protein
MYDLGTLRVDALIVHEIPSHTAGQQGAGPILSEIECPLSTELRSYFKERIANSLGTAAYEVVRDPVGTSPVPQLILDRLSSKRGLVDASHEIARHLSACQTGVNPVGLLVVASAHLGRTPTMAILKLEKEEGVRVHQDKVAGKFTFSVEHLRELMLTEGTRVFKVGAFSGQPTQLADLEGIASDKQRGYQPKTEIADFFLRRFLGCMLREAPDIATRRFFQASQEFINSDVSDPTTRARYEMALLTELHSSRTTIRPRQFAQDHLVGGHRQAFIDHLEAEGTVSQQLQKDISLIRTQLSRVQMDFNSGVAVIAPPETFDHELRMRQLDDGRTRVEIEDDLKDIRGKK